MADDDASADDLPISWDEAREVVIVVATVAATVMLLGPVVGFFGDRYSGFSLSDDIAEVTRNAGPSTGVLVLVAALIVAVTPPTDVVPVLRRGVAVVAFVIAVFAVAAMTVEMTRPSGSGVAGRLQIVMSRSGPGLMLAVTARWLTLRVVPFGGRAR
ncbi:MAG: hypothetical protein ACPHJY_06625 [Acidimicrobiales bacterium]